MVRSSRGLRLTLGLMAAVAFVAGCSDDGDEETKAETTATNPASGRSGPEAGGDLFVQVAGRGTLRPTGERDTFTLRLLDADANVSVFSDRPLRRAGREPVERFVERWKARGFEKDPPNAALELARGKEDRDVKIFEISAPRLDAEAGALQFTARELGDSPSTALAGFSRMADREVPTRFDRATLFVDPSSTSGPPKVVNITMSVQGGEQGEADVTLDPDQDLVQATFNASLDQVTRGGVLRTGEDQLTLLCEPPTSTATCRLTARIVVLSSKAQVSGNIGGIEGNTTVTGSAGGGAVPLPAGPFALPK